MNNLALNIGEAFGSPFGQTVTIGSLVTLVIRGALTVAGVILLFLFISSGYSIIAGAGKDNPEELTKAKQSITSALIGFGIIFVAYWIIRILELITGINFVTAPTF